MANGTSKLARLEFLIGVSDKATSKVARISKNIEAMTKRATRGFTEIGIGAAAIAGSGYAVQRLVSPAIEMQRALNSLSSVGADAEALGHLDKEARKFAKSYGGSATDIVNASYSMQGSISGLQGEQLAKFTVAAATLARGTKGSTEVIVDYMGTMYGIFKDEADIDRVTWIEDLAGKTAWAIGKFKSDGNKMASAFVALGSMAQVQGIAMSEQFAILGELQATMSGSEAGTKYKAFLRGVVKAQKELGLSFTDSNGKMLSTVEILEKIKGKYGDLDANEIASLTKGFGSDEASAFIVNLLAKTEDIRSNIAGLNDVKGMDYAKDMATAVTDIWERFGGVIDALMISFGSMMLPTLEKGVEKLVALADYLDWLMEECPNLTKYVGLFGVALLAVSGAMGALAIVTAVTQLSFAGITGPFKLFIKLMKLLRVATIAQTAVQWAANAAMWANPVGVVVLAVLALIAAVGTLIYFWDDVRAYLGSTEWGQRLLAVLDYLGIGFGSVKEAALSLLKLAFLPIYGAILFLQEAWGFLSEKFADVTWTEILIAAIKGIMGPLGILLDGVSYLAGLAGFDVPTFGPSVLGAAGSAASAPTASTPASLKGVTTSKAPQGGIFSAYRDFITSNTSNQGQSLTVGEQHFHFQNPLSPEQIEEYNAMQMG